MRNLFLLPSPRREKETVVHDTAAAAIKRNPPIFLEKKRTQLPILWQNGAAIIIIRLRRVIVIMVAQTKT
jgi:hypothetical protein